MSAIETRHISRDSLFLLADIAIDGQFGTSQTKVRNLSNGGMMAEAGCNVAQGNRVTVTLKNIGKIRGIVAWVQGSRFGIAFDEEIDASKARAQKGASPSEAPRHTRPSLSVAQAYSKGHTARPV